MNLYLWIFLGSGLGGALRFAVNGVVSGRYGEAFPWGTMLINITGSFVIAFFFTLTGPEGRVVASPTVRQFVMTGIVGGYTTYSAFSLQTLNLARNGDWTRAAGYAFGTFVLCFVAAWLGHVCAAGLNAAKGA